MFDRWFGLARSLAIYHNPVRIRAWRRFYQGILKEGDLAFDVGAHVGIRSRAMRAAGARVVAIEPQDLFAGFLRLTLPRDIVLVEAAVGGAEGETELAVSSRHPTVSSMRTDFVSRAGDTPGFEHVRWDRVQRVRTVTLDGLIARYGLPAYVKIDVEGYELEVLSRLSQPLPMLSVEFLPGFASLTLDVIDRLETFGAYQFNPVAGESGAFLWPEWRDSAATREWLKALPRDGESGDLFARFPVS